MKTGREGTAFQYAAVLSRSEMCAVLSLGGEGRRMLCGWHSPRACAEGGLPYLCILLLMALGPREVTREDVRAFSDVIQSASGRRQ